MGTKAAVAFANIFMAKIENQIIENSEVKPLEWVRFIDDIASFWDATKDEVEQFVQKETNSTRLLNSRLKSQTTKQIFYTKFFIKETAQKTKDFRHQCPLKSLLKSTRPKDCQP